ncbi:MAG: hypothetical protein WCD86_02710 [Ktedonobacteraceae bacterium]
MDVTQRSQPFGLHNARHFFRGAVIRRSIALFFCFLFLVTPLAWGSLVPNHSFGSIAQASSSPFQQFNIPYFHGPVPFNQAAIFWFGDVTSSDNYVNVRMGYNNQELYIDLHIVDLSLWYDPHATAPNLNMGDTATVYLDTTSNGSKSPDRFSYKFLAQVDQYQLRTYYQQASQGNGSGWAPSSLPFTTVSGWRGSGFNGKQDAGWTMTYHLPFFSLGLSGPPSSGTAWKLAL